MTQYINYIIGAIFALIGLTYQSLKRDIAENKLHVEDHEKRIQKVEDLHGRDIEEVKKTLASLIIKIDKLSEYIHNDTHGIVDLIQQQKDIIARMHKFINDKEYVAKG